MSPELIVPDRFGLKNSRPTKHSDCYALGMVIYETISGKPPFHKDTNQVVSMKVVEGKHPPRGMRFTETLWRMLELCWMTQPSNRPTIGYVLQCLEVVSNLSEPPSGADEETEGNDDWDSTTDSSGILSWSDGTAIAQRNTSISPLAPPNYPGDRPPTSTVWAAIEPPTGGTYRAEIPVVTSVHSPAELNTGPSTSNAMWAVAYDPTVPPVSGVDWVPRGSSSELVLVPRHSFEQGISLDQKPSISIIPSFRFPTTLPDPQIPLSFWKRTSFNFNILRQMRLT